eukprot:scaffold84625_cov69-Phaeocystis_antarctica.AAC.2
MSSWAPRECLSDFPPWLSCVDARVLTAHALTTRRALATTATAPSAASTLALATSAKSTRPAEQRRSRTNMIGATSARSRQAELRRAEALC